MSQRRWYPFSRLRGLLYRQSQRLAEVFILTSCDGDWPCCYSEWKALCGQLLWSVNTERGLAWASTVPDLLSQPLRQRRFGNRLQRLHFRPSLTLAQQPHDQLVPLDVLRPSPVQPSRPGLLDPLSLPPPDVTVVVPGNRGEYAFDGAFRGSSPLAGTSARRLDAPSSLAAPHSRWMGSIHFTVSGFSMGSMSRLTTTDSPSLRTRTHSRVSSRLALISWWGTKGGT